MQQVAAGDRAIKSLTENRAAETMWAYYKANKAEIHSDVSEFREVILTELMRGADVVKVFAPFVLEPEPIAPAPRTRNKRSNHGPTQETDRKC